MKSYAAEHGTDSIPKQAYPIWLQLREILTEQSDLVLLSAEAKSVKIHQNSQQNFVFVVHHMLSCC